MFFGICAIVGLLSVIGVKYLTSARIQSRHLLIAAAEQELNRIKNELKAAESNKAVAQNELKSNEKRQGTLKNRIEKYDRDIESLKK
jgi:DNA repair ATPase RecN